MELYVNATPTKELFIDFMIRDISLIDAIIDLVDNATDGARALRCDGNFDDLRVEIETTPEYCSISDNCGGFTAETGRTYAFRFGRADGAPFVANSVGQFGIGMKRAIFKMGRQFSVKSTTKTTKFEVEQDIDEWAKDSEWRFLFKEVEENLDVPQDQWGTLIHITRLHPDVKDCFGPGNFEGRLREALRSRIGTSIDRGLTVFLNGHAVVASTQLILTHPNLLTAYKHQTFNKKKQQRVEIRLYCGLGDSEDARAAGWYVYCNARLVLEADKTELTAWGGKNGTRLPAFHPQFNHFRGFAYFDSVDAGLLPWNTTKTALNVDSEVYRGMRPAMRTLMRPVIDFLNELSKEKAQKEKSETDEAGPLEDLVKNSPKSSILQTATRETFTVPKIRGKEKPPQTQRIQYDKPKSEIEMVKKVLGVTTLKEVGKQTFDYFLTVRWRSEYGGPELRDSPCQEHRTKNDVRGLRAPG